jgi:hypothetical protein
LSFIEERLPFPLSWHGICFKELRDALPWASYAAAQILFSKKGGRYGKKQNYHKASIDAGGLSPEYSGPWHDLLGLW